MNDSSDRQAQNPKTDPAAQQPGAQAQPNEPQAESQADAHATPPPDSTAAPRRRLWPHLIRGTLGTALALVCIYSLVCVWTLHSASRAYLQAQYDETVRLSERFERISLFEHHKPPFNIGTVAAAEGRYDDAQPLLERALDLTPVRDECAVRINLAYVFEQQAEEFKTAESTDEANEKFDLARTTLQEAPEECRPEGGGTDKQMDESEQRIDESQEAMNNPDGGSDGGDDGGDDPGGDGGDDGGDDGGEDDTGGGGGDGGEDEGSGGDGSDGGGQETEAERKQRELEERNREADQRQRDDEDNRRDNSGNDTKPW
ncbi:hypothetical protein M3B11_04220 [Brevibacterium sp. p3-SID960]|uniref:hypothetical protein n=1 Tax=Brevibacterium sp. p3-SID960 TaxID=2916063 RepID=UPI0021A43AAD|nr:hypothetical protein [Brevibacterium sp. p3-SID960]MCT1690167.1 hypothetical protein [Brevibacterium sp. p3-SID960]